MIIFISVEVLVWLIVALLGGIVAIANATKLLSILFLAVGLSVWITYLLVTYLCQGGKWRVVDWLTALIGAGAYSAVIQFFISTSEVHTLPLWLMNALLLLAAIALPALLPRHVFLRTIAALACILISLLWCIGFDYSYKAHVQEDNIAYYEMLADGKFTTVNDSDERQVVKYQENQIFFPVPVEIDRSNPFWQESDSFIDDTYYPILLEDGQTAAVFSGKKNGCDVKIYYYADSEPVRETQELLRRRRWYGFLPQSVLDGCERFFELIHPTVRIYLVEQ